MMSLKRNVGVPGEIALPTSVTPPKRSKKDSKTPRARKKRKTSKKESSSMGRIYILVQSNQNRDSGHSHHHNALMMTLTPPTPTRTPITDVLIKPKILGTIFSFLDLESLKSSRLCCRSWKDVAEPPLQARSKVIITLNHPQGRAVTLAQFMEYVEIKGYTQVFFRNYELVDWDMVLKGWCKSQVSKFWNWVGPWIINLRMNLCTFHGEGIIRKIMYNWTPNMESMDLDQVTFKTSLGLNPTRASRRITGRVVDERPKPESDDPIPGTNLKFRLVIPKEPNINLHTFRLELHEEAPHFPIQWMELFSAFPNMKKLMVVPVTDNKGTNNINDLLENLLKAQEEKKPLKLKELDVFSELNPNENICDVNEQLSLFSQLKLSLETLSIGFEAVERDLATGLMARGIQRSSSTLKSLILLSNDPTSFPVWLGPHIRKTVFTSLSDLTVSPTLICGDGLDFLLNTPNLRRLSFGSGIWEFPVASTLIPGTMEFTGCESLVHLNVEGLSLSTRSIEMIGRWFPGLKRLDALLNDDLLIKVYGVFWNRLEELVVRSIGITDNGIGLRTVMRRNRKDPELSHRLMSSMKKLRRLTIGPNYGQVPDACAVALTDEAIHSFMDLEGLTSLDLTLTPIPLVTFGALQTLATSLNLSNLSVKVPINWDSPSSEEGISHSDCEFLEVTLKDVLQPGLRLC